MDCCDNNNDTSKKYGENADKRREIKMNKRMILWIVIGILFLAVLYLTFKVNTLDVNAVQSAGTAIQSAASSSAMVGGC